MPAAAPVLASKLANALLPDAEPSALADALTGDGFVLEQFRKRQGGLWVGGRVTLTADQLLFVPNALNNAVHENASARQIPLARVVGAGDRFGWLTRIIDVALDDGTVFTFRCFGAKAFAAKIAEAARACRAG